MPSWSTCHRRTLGLVTVDEMKSVTRASRSGCRVFGLVAEVYAACSIENDLPRLETLLMWSLKDDVVNLGCAEILSPSIFTNRFFARSIHR